MTPYIFAPAGKIATTTDRSFIVIEVKARPLTSKYCAEVDPTMKASDATKVASETNIVIGFWPITIKIRQNMAK